MCFPRETSTVVISTAVHLDLHDYAIEYRGSWILEAKVSDIPYRKERSQLVFDYFLELSKQCHPFFN